MHVLFDVSGIGVTPDITDKLNLFKQILTDNPGNIRGVLYPTAADRAIGCFNERVDLSNMSIGQRQVVLDLANSLSGKTIYESVGDISRSLNEFPKTTDETKALSLNVLKQTISNINAAISHIENDGALEDLNVLLAKAKNDIDLTAHLQNINVEAQQIALLVHKANSIYYTIDDATIAKNYYAEQGVVSDIVSTFNSRDIPVFVLISVDCVQPINFGYDVVLPKTVLNRPNDFELIKIGRKG